LTLMSTAPPPARDLLTAAAGLTESLRTGARPPRS
jgi:hypothetical protein